MIRRSPRLAFLVVVLTAGASPAAAAEFRPFSGRVSATWDNVFNGLFAPPANFTGGGPVTHMGNTKQHGTLTLGAAVGAGIFPGYGTVTITAANGDQVTFDYLGFLNAATGEGIGIFEFTGGTGRFASATGSGTFAAQIDVSVPTDQSMTVVLDGKINY